MPELPEVETIRRRLEPDLVGQRVVAVRVNRPEIVGYPSVRTLVRQVTGRRITGLARRGKYLIVRLDDHQELIFHLRLSGALYLVNNSKTPPYERIQFRLASGNRLSLAEPRMLGRVYLVGGHEYPAVLAGMTKMGREPIEPGFTASYLAARLHGRKTKVKTLLLDQRICCGVGNIYSDEALFRAGVRPTRRAGSLTRAEIGRLARALRQVLKEGISWCGTTIADRRYVLPDGTSGGFQKYLRVFRRGGERCGRCGATIQRVRIGNRSSCYCPVCQK